MTEKEFWRLLGGKELLELMLDARNFRFYNKSGRYKFLKYSGNFIFNDPVSNNLTYRVCINQHICGVNPIWVMFIFYNKGGNKFYKRTTYQPKILRYFLETLCRVTLTF